MYKKSLSEKNMTLTISNPNDFTSDTLSEYTYILRKGGAVNVNEDRLASAAYWAIIKDEVTNKLAAAGSLKSTAKNLPYYHNILGRYKAALRQEFNTSDYPFDLGYIVTDSDFRKCGHCNMIIDSLLELVKDCGILATTQNQSIKNKLEIRGFKSQGAKWLATDNGFINLYLRQRPDHAH
ncbi:hypothetical protein [Klebsiella grimontii]|uniref:hypothetical protein n=1 Tax=Klebsiella grimontii TaxID=2058152 RepID=UPI0031B6CB8A